MKNNRLIAQFMGIKPNMTGPDSYALSDPPFWYVTGHTPEEVMIKAADLFKYESSWDKLMPVVERIQEICHLELKIPERFKPIGESLWEGIQVTYREVVTFIEVYNATGGKMYEDVKQLSFPNGVDSFIRTHYDVVQWITDEIHDNEEGVIRKMFEEYGHGSFYDIAIDLTHKYEVIKSKGVDIYENIYDLFRKEINNYEFKA